MKFKVSVSIIVLIALLSLTAGCSFAKVYVAEPYLIEQPPYAGMTFYVYKPYGLPKGWYLTFNGYAVTQTQGETWVYGTMQAGELVKTGYVVGSINPAFAGIIPYSNANSINTAQAETRIVSQPLGASPNQKARQVYVPDWSVNPSFLAISNWNKTVDRIGILYKYNIPVAWKGNRPSVIYAWTGKIWRQFEAHDMQLPDTINMNLYTLLRELEKGSYYRWYAEDVPILTEKTISWGYIWMGEIYVRN